MVNEKLKKSLAVAMAASLVATSFPVASYTKVLQAHAKTANKNETSTLAGDTGVSKDDDGVYKVTMDDTGKITADEDVAADVNTPFSWDNANVYFALTDRFYNGDTSNDHSYGRSEGEANAADYKNRTGTFHGGDLKGMTEKIEEGYFDKLGTNAIWITAPYEQIHGALCASKFKHYSYHGYYVLDYTNVDANMGTEKELETFIDTAHEHGIRVIFDIVMNHAGYADAKTANEYGFGKLASNWKDIYYTWDESQYQWYNDYTGEAAQNGSQGMMDPSGDWTTNWWGSSWVRAIGSRFNGYDGSEGDSNEITKCLDGLPDFKTETTNDPGIPGILKAKWTKEGTYDEKVASTKANMSARGLSPSVTGYIATWLSDWVEKYGVDGFRCDTAKHIETKEWGKLSSACSKALETWRKNNPNKPGAQWTDDFWMTGEHWGHGVGKDAYYTTGGFDSMINFSYQRNYNKKPQEMESIYSDYAQKINNDSSFNVLSYISSHDTPSSRSDEFKYSLLSAHDGGTSGISLLLLPGGVQTYYGDESGRTEWKSPSGCTGDQIVRSDMNWNSMDTARLEVWQKVGRFRRNHIAVGAGQHKKISDSPYTFSRTYKGKATVGAETKTDYEDKVVVSLPGSAGTYDVDVSSVFDDGTTLLDSYSGEEYTVNGGKVSATCDSKGVILLGEISDTTPKAKVTASVGDKSAYTEDKFTTTIKTENVTDATYQINDCTPVSFTDSADITIGEDTAYEETTTVKVTGKSSIDSSEVSKTFTYKRSKEPTVGQASEGFYLRMSKAAYEKASGQTGVPLVWIYDDKASYSGASWDSRDKMTLDETGEYYVWQKDTLTSEVYVIVTAPDADTWRSVPDKKNGGTVKGTLELDPSKEYTDADQIKTITLATGEKATVTVKYVDSQDKELKTITRVGAVDANYTVYAPKTLSTVSGYELAEGQDTSKTGKFTAEEQTVTFTYTKVGEVITPTPEVKTPDPTVTPTDDVTPTPTEVVTTVEPTQEPTEAPTEGPTQEPTQEPTQAPTQEPTAVPTETPKTLEAKVSTNPATKQIAGYAVKITGYAANGSGDYKYRFIVEDAYGNFVYTKAYTSTASGTWKPRSAGEYVITVYVKDEKSGKVTTASKDYKVTSALSVKKFDVKRLKKLQYQLESLASGGAGTYKYQFSYTYKGKTKIIKKYSSKRICKNAFTKAGVYKITVSVKDKKRKVVKKTKTVRVK